MNVCVCVSHESPLFAFVNYDLFAFHKFQAVAWLRYLKAILK